MANLFSSNNWGQIGPFLNALNEGGLVNASEVTSDGVRIMRALGQYLSPGEMAEIARHPEALVGVRVALRTSQQSRLVRNRFTPWAEALTRAARWPGVTNEMLVAAGREFEASGRKARYEAASPGEPFLQAVVVPYRESVTATVVYACKRWEEAFGSRADIWWRAYGNSFLPKDEYIRLAPGAADHPVNCVRIEVIGLADNFYPRGEIIPSGVKGCLAHAAALYAPIQNQEWFWSIDDVAVPSGIAAGYVLNVSGFDEWVFSPCFGPRCAGALLSGLNRNKPYRNYAAPLLRE